MRPLLGDFLAAASEHIDAATNDDLRLPHGGHPAVVKRTGPPDRRDGTLRGRVRHRRAAPTRATCWTPRRWQCWMPGQPCARQRRACAQPQAHSATAATMHAIPPLSAWHRPPLTSQPAMTCCKHTSRLDQSGSRHGTSLWAPAIASAPVNAALVNDHWQLRRPPGAVAAPARSRRRQAKALPAPAQVAISAACRWLRIAEAATWAVSRHPGTAAEQALLRAIPVNIPPPRHSPRGDEPIPELVCGRRRHRRTAASSGARPGRPQPVPLGQASLPPGSAPPKAPPSPGTAAN